MYTGYNKRSSQLKVIEGLYEFLKRVVTLRVCEFEMHNPKKIKSNYCNFALFLFVSVVLIFILERLRIYVILLPSIIHSDTNTN